jgi:hypothetical protein
MAVITHIEVANFLGEGYGMGGQASTDKWSPLYRGVTLPLRGQSTAVQVNNGDGKSSLTDGCLYLLSRDHRLKERVQSRCAPSDKGWSHVRIEFGEKTPGENLLQSDLITRNADEFPGIRYVIGMCWNRDSIDPHFYRYQGELTDTPVYEKTASGLALIANDAFRNSVEKIKGFRWNKWGRISDWHEEIKFFIDVAVVRQNVDFQLKGAGDASAMLKEIKPDSGESFDAAFFRQAIAPELLKDAMGAEAGGEETHYEDTLLRSLIKAANSTTDIAKSQSHLDQAEAALQKFEPVLDKAQAVIRANDDYQRELDAVVKDAAIIHLLADRHPVPGIPQIPPSPVWRNDKRLLQALSHMVIDKGEGALITDEGLAELIGVATGKLNEAALDKKIGKVIGLAQVIDIKGDIKTFSKKPASEDGTADSSQVIDIKGDIKISDQRGGRRREVSFYALPAAGSIVTALAHYQGADVTGLDEILIRAFGIVTQELDTNSYRRTRNKLVRELVGATTQYESASEDNKEWQKKIEILLSDAREAKENQIAFENFAERKSEFPEDYWESPVAAKRWAETNSSDTQRRLQEHISKVGELSKGFTKWEKLTAQHAPTTLDKALSDLAERHATFTSDKDLAQQLLEEARVGQRTIQGEWQQQSAVLTTVKKSFNELEQLRTSLPVYEQLFGDADPDTLDPRREISISTKEREESGVALSNAQRSKSDLEELSPLVAVFRDIFGDSDPVQLNPSQVDRAHREKISAEESNIALLQEGVESLNLFRERHPALTPEQWLTETAKKRIVLHSEKGQNIVEINGWRADLLDLDKYALADSRVYAQALAALDAANIPYERLHSVITAAVDGERRTSLLTLFSSALSAPVLSIDDAQSATQLLEQERVTVPVFLVDPLLHFVATGEIEKSGDLSHTFLVGRRTRQVDMLLNPNLIKEEKIQIEQQINTHITRNDEIEKQLKEISEDSEIVAEAMRAKTAIARNAEGKLKEAQDELAKLHTALKDIERRASKEALSAIGAMIRFNKQGGAPNLQELTEKTIPLLKIRLKKIHDQIVVLETQSSGEALRALHNIRKFKAAGGEEEYARLKHEIFLLEPVVEALLASLDEIKQKIEHELEGKLASANNVLSALLQTYSHEKHELETAVNFESEGHHTFMFEAEEKGTQLQTAVNSAQKRLQGIDFERAARYLENKTEDRSVADRIANAKAKKIEADRIMDMAHAKIADINGQMAKLGPLVDMLHDLAFQIREKGSKLAGFSDDIRLRMRSEMGTHPDMQKYAEEIRFACMDESPGTSDYIRATIANLHASMASLNIDTKHLGSLKNTQRSAQREFLEKRADFCEKARNKEITGLHELEISKIEAANSVEELAEIQELRDLINKTIEERKAELQKTTELAHASKNASINNMTRFARAAERNLDLLGRVMKKSPNARFFIEAQVADEAHIRIVVESLLADIEDRERVARERTNAPTNGEIARRERGYRELVQEAVYREIFINPKVDFSHAGIWNGDRRPFNEILSMGQKTALHLMWLIKQAEYSLLRATYQFSSKKERDAALRNSQHILFFDGLFSNLSNDRIINEAFEGLKYVGDAFQLIGLIHNTRYVNNKDIFPVHLIGRRFQKPNGEKSDGRGFVTVEPWQRPGDMGLFTSIFKRNAGDAGTTPTA